MNNKQDDPANSIFWRSTGVCIVVFFLAIAFYMIGDLLLSHIVSQTFISFLIGAGMALTVSGIYVLADYIMNGTAKKVTK